jgi:hypothetical protein
MLHVKMESVTAQNTQVGAKLFIPVSVLTDPLGIRDEWVSIPNSTAGAS